MNVDLRPGKPFLISFVAIEKQEFLRAPSGTRPNHHRRTPHSLCRATRSRFLWEDFESQCASPACRLNSPTTSMAQSKTSIDPKTRIFELPRGSKRQAHPCVD